jgi:hypothetical protein
MAREHGFGPVRIRRVVRETADGRVLTCQGVPATAGITVVHED